MEKYYIAESDIETGYTSLYEATKEQYEAWWKKKTGFPAAPGTIVRPLCFGTAGEIPDPRIEKIFMNPEAYDYIVLDNTWEEKAGERYFIPAFKPKE